MKSYMYMYTYEDRESGLGSFALETSRKTNRKLSQGGSGRQDLSISIQLGN